MNILFSFEMQSDYENKDFALALPSRLEPRLPCRQSLQLRTGRPGLEAHLAKNRHVRKWHLVHVKSVVGAISSKFPSKLYLGGY